MGSALRSSLPLGVSGRPLWQFGPLSYSGEGLQRAALLAIKGVGPKKLDQYGQALLDITRQGAEESQAKEQEA